MGSAGPRAGRGLRSAEAERERGHCVADSVPDGPIPQPLLRLGTFMCVSQNRWLYGCVYFHSFSISDLSAQPFMPSFGSPIS